MTVSDTDDLGTLRRRADVRVRKAEALRIEGFGLGQLLTVGFQRLR